MVLPPWIRLVVACALAMWLAYDLGETAFRVALAAMAVLWAAWAVLSVAGEE